MTFKSLMSKALAVKSEGFVNHYKQAFADAHGVVSIGMIAAEAISILILIVVLVLIPTIGSAIEDNMPAINSTSHWAEYTGAGASTWGQVSPLITVAVIVCIIGLVLKVIWDLKRNNNN